MQMWKRNLVVCWLGSFATAAALSQVAPILPLYIQHLGVHNRADIELWTGIAFGCTTLAVSLVAPFWGKLADQYGRKPMLLRASLGMAVILSCTGFVQNVYELVGLRLLLGTIAGFNSGAITLIATQTPKERAGWALGTLSTGVMGGALLGPLLGGFLAEAAGFRNMFFVMGALLSVAFVLTLFFVKEQAVVVNKQAVLSFWEVWRKLPDQQLLVSMFLTTFILQVALFSIEPILTIYIDMLSPANEHLALISGLVFAASGVASVLAASSLGKLSDRVGAHKVILVALLAAGVLFVPQAMVKTEWQLMALRFLLGIACAALMPSINTLLKQHIPDVIAGRIFGYNQSAQFLGTFVGALIGGQIAAHFGLYYVFYLTSALLLMNAVWVYYHVFKRIGAKLSSASNH